jgi:diacylglycerol kinase (ATP)
MNAWTTIVNGAAGGGRCAEVASAALDRLRASGMTLDVHFTERPGHATEIARRCHEEGARQFITVGGDGTSFEVINGLFPRTHDDTVTLGFLPLGTGNSFIRDFGVTDTETAIEALIRGDRRTCDVVKVTHDAGELHYINLMSVGFSAKVGALTNRRFKPFGAAGYALAVGVSVLGLEQPRYTMTVDDGARDDRPCTLISFSNSRYTGGTMMMAPSADPGDGAVDIIRIGKLSRLGLLRAFPKIYQGSHVALQQVEARLAKTITFHGAGAVDCMIDGEILSLSLRTLDVLPSALEVMA